MTITNWRNLLTEEQKLNIMERVLANTTDGKYGSVVFHDTDKNYVHNLYKVCTELNFQMVSSSDGQFTGGYSQEVYTANNYEFHVFSFQDGKLYEYEKRIKDQT